MPEHVQAWNDSDANLHYRIIHTGDPAVQWNEDVGPNQRSPIGHLDDGTRIVVVTDNVTGAVYYNNQFQTIPGGGHYIKCAGNEPNIHCSMQAFARGTFPTHT